MRMKRTGKIVITLVTVLLLVFTVACAPATLPEGEAVTEEEELVTEEEKVTPTPIAPAGMGVIEVYVTDPPDPEFSSIEVFIDPIKGVEVHRVVPGESGNWTTVSPLAVTSFDLVTLVGVTEFLGSVNATAGSFTQIRIAVEAVKVNGDNATLPSDTLKIVRPFNVQEGLITVLTLDFNGEKSVVTTGQGGYIFKPVVRLLVEHSSPPETGGDTTLSGTPLTAVEDTTPPVIDVTGVIDGEQYSGSVTPVISVSDDTDPNPSVVSATLDGYPFVSETEVSEIGEHELKVKAIDASGNEAEVAVNFEIVAVEDTTAPVITITGVADGEQYSGSVTPEFTVSDEDPNPTVTATLNGDIFISGTVVSEVGEYELEVTAIDVSGNAAEVKVNFEMVQE